MIYQEYIPNISLAEIVDKYWIVSNIESEFERRVFPENCTSFVFRLNGSTGSANLLGVSTCFEEFKPTLGDYYFGISFIPGVLGQFTKENFSILRDSYIPSKELFPRFNESFLEKLNELKTDLSRIDFVEELLKKEFYNYTFGQSSITSLLAHSLNKNHHQTTEALSNTYNKSIRKLQRDFKHEVGISIKMYARITRFNKTLKRIAENKNEPLLNISFDLGYYDHSHLTNEIKVFSGYTPSYFK